MLPEYLDSSVRAMRDRGVAFAPGLTPTQIAAAEAAHGFRFPPDLREFLERALPVGDRFPDWRTPGSEELRGRFAWPAEGICFDVEHNDFWLPEWGDRPESLDAAQERARRAVREAPVLVPIFAHRFLPAAPIEPGNPVFSVYQTDIIFYGLDFADYLAGEFGVPNPFAVPEAPREIPFWSELERRNGQASGTRDTLNRPRG